MASVSEALDRARLPLNDQRKRRYPDTTLTIYLLEGLRTIRRQRPDLFLGHLVDPFTIDETDIAQLHLDDGYLPQLCDYVTARAQLHDIEAKAVEKAQVMLALAAKGLA